MKFTAKELLEELPLPANEKWKEGVWDVEPFRRDNLSLVFFAPKGKDYQTFHEADEMYFIISGTGELVIGDERHTFAAGDAFFVPAYVEHRFDKFTDDFATWAIFF